jgi:hypothetical protein
MGRATHPTDSVVVNGPAVMADFLRDADVVGADRARRGLALPWISNFIVLGVSGVLLEIFCFNQNTSRGLNLNTLKQE